jgi:hypothetical protein
MSSRHPEFCALVERLATERPPTLRDADRELLSEYANPPHGAVEDQLGSGTVEAVEELTGRSAVWSPERASRALLAELSNA